MSSSQLIQKLEKQILSVLDAYRCDEVLFNGSNQIFAVSAQSSVAVQEALFGSDEEFFDLLYVLAEHSDVRLDAHCPYGGGVFGIQRLRWHAVIPPISREFPALTIRRHQMHRLKFDDFDVKKETLLQIIEFSRQGGSIIVCGPTFSGKTSFLATLLKETCEQERLVIIEKIAEIPLLNPRWIHLVESQDRRSGGGAVDLSQLMAQTLRLRPDRIVLGEIRSDEARILPLALYSGHGGVWATMHADSSQSALRRLKALSQQTEEINELITQDLLRFVIMKRGAPPQVCGLERA